MKQTILIALLLTVGCDKPAAPSPEAVKAPDVAPPPRRVDVPPPPVVGAAPDFEDAAGTVAERDGRWVIDVADQTPICFPFDAPANIRTVGAEVRFTLYLSGETVNGCREVRTFVSAYPANSDR